MDDILQSRGLAHLTARFLEEKIDEHVASLMTDDELIQLGVTKFGDGVAIKAQAASLVKEENKVKKPDDGTASRLLARVRAKLDGKTGNVTKQWGNKNAVKKKRRVEIGWLMDRSGEVKQVRTKKGGGTRHLNMDGNSSVAEVKARATELFFPNTVSSFWGSLDSYDISMTNFDTTNIEDESLTVQQLYEMSETKILRLYLCTTAKKVISSKTKKLCLKKKEKPASDTESVEEDVVFESLQVELPDLDDDLPDILPLANSTQQLDDPLEVSGSGLSQNFSVLPLANSPQQQDPLEVSGSDVSQNFPVFPVANSTQLQDPTEVSNTGLLPNFPVWTDGDNDEMEVFFGSIDSEGTTLTNDNVTLKLHRGHVLEELEEYFMLNNDFNMRNTPLSIQMVLPNGELERATDNGGVLRDALSEYWESFYIKRTSGDQVKVPALSHTVDGQRLEAVGKILCAGFYYERFFPVQLASCFLEYAVTGDTVSKDILLAQFLKYLPESERKIAEMSLNNYEAVEEEELLDFLSDHNVKVKPSKENIKRILEETAHKELLQVPTYVADCWKVQLKELKKLLPKSFCEMQDMIPDFRRVWKMISYDRDADFEIIGYLKKLLKELSTGQLQKFLRFCTGADILIGKKITVRLVESNKEFTRTPVAHVCGCVLEIPKSYSSFVELRNDFVSVLESSVWTMDFD